MRGEIRRRRPNSCSPSRRLVENPGGNSWWDRGVRASSCPPRAEGGKENKGEAGGATLNLRSEKGSNVELFKAW